MELEDTVNEYGLKVEIQTLEFVIRILSKDYDKKLVIKTLENYKKELEAQLNG